MGKAKRLGTKPAVTISQAIAPKMKPVGVAAIVANPMPVVAERAPPAEPVAAPIGEPCDARGAEESVDLYDVVCSFECVVATALSFGVAQTTAIDHNTAHANHDAQPIRRQKP